jgi:uncharacterized protein (TIGR02246 family)
MRSIFTPLCLAVFLAAPALAQLQPEATIDRAVAASPDTVAQQAHDGLRKLRSVMEEAMNSGDIDAILANVDDDVVFTTMNGDVARGKEAIREYYQKMMTGPDRVVQSVTTKFEPDDLSILHGDGVAIAFGRTQDHYVLSNGDEFDISARWSGTMLADDGGWKVASFHYSDNIFDNPVIDAQRRILIGFGVALAVLTGALGFWLGRRRRTA